MRNFLSQLITKGVYLLAFLLPLGTRYILNQGVIGDFAWEYATISIFALESLIWLLAITSIVLHAIDFDDEIHFRNQKLFMMILLMIGLGVTSIATIFFSDYHNIALQGALRLLEGIALVLILVHAKFSLHRFAQCLVASSVIQSALGMAQFASQKVFASTILGVSQKLPEVLGISVLTNNGERVLRAYGTFSHPNIYGFFVVMGIVISLGLLFTYRSTLEKWLIMCALAIHSAGLFVSFSRSAYLAMFVSALIVCLYVVINKNKKLMFTLGIGLIALLVVQTGLLFAYQDVMMERLAPTQVLSSTSTLERQELLSQARQLLTLRWERGIGVGAYPLFAHDALGGAAGVVPQPVHNTFLLVLVEIGIAGGILLVGLLYHIIRNIIVFRVGYSSALLAELEKFQRADMYEQEYGFTTHWYIIFSALVFGALSIFFFDHYMWSNVTGIIMFWMIVGLWMRQFVRVRV
ncbi:O-antigen ligase family protein [Candidatus Falkowbacteria bacterium]|nr:O-antigen ligase family protein [Candidatus Falkowbacteria bacterium]